MATIYRCDRCKKETDKREELRPIGLQRMNRGSFQSDVVNDVFIRDLCSECWQKVVSLAEERPTR